MEHGVGPSLLFFFGNGIDGRDFEAFANGGIKVRPVALTWRNVIAEKVDLWGRIQPADLPKRLLQRKILVGTL